MLVKNWFKYNALIFFLIIALPIYAWKIEPNLVHVNQVTLGKKNQREPLNVVQLSDIQVSEFYETKRLDKVIKKSIVKTRYYRFTGDLFDNYAKNPQQKEPMIEKLKQLQATIGKYAVWEIMIMVAVLLRCMMKSWRPVALPL